MTSIFRHLSDLELAIYDTFVEEAAAYDQEVKIRVVRRIAQPNWSGWEVGEWWMFNEQGQRLQANGTQLAQQANATMRMFQGLDNMPWDCMASGERRSPKARRRSDERARQAARRARQAMRRMGKSDRVFWDLAREFEAQLMAPRRQAILIGLDDALT